MKTSTSWLLLAVANVSLFIGIFTFAFGFFPYKPFLPGLSVFEADTDVVTAPFDKVIFIVIDALRSDFIYSNRSNFKFMQSLISSGAALPFTAHAGSPTITMPRVKSMATGSIPGFLDLILNFAESDTTSTLAHQDNWPAQIKAGGGRVIFYGDDTWVKLLPETFHRSEGVTSFFVSDFVEVDNNVTRHIDIELQNKDWDAMILHYLGLDHVGHKAGPLSAFMAPKQAEMDSIIRRIYTSMETEPHLSSTLMVVCGDHGMNDAGGHGGSTPGESSAALVFMSPKLKEHMPGLPCPTEPTGEFHFYNKVQQPDLVPTLAGLLKFPIPKNNLGMFIPSFLTLWNEKERVQLVLQNAQQIIQVVRAAYPNFETIRFDDECQENVSEPAELACWWARANSELSLWRTGDKGSGVVIELLQKFTKRSQDILAMAASNYDLKLMWLGILALAVGSVTSAIVLFTRPLDSMFFVLVWPALAISYGIMMFASSYVEEEQNFWYWVNAGWCFALVIKERRNGLRGISSLGLLTIARVIRRWNQTGQKHSGASDIVTNYLLKHTTIMWIAILGTYIYSWYQLRYRVFRRLGQGFGFVLAVTIATAGAAFKLSFATQDAAEMIPAWLGPLAGLFKQTPIVSQARAVFLSLVLAITFTVLFESRSRGKYSDLRVSSVLLDLLTVFLATQSRFYNVPLLLLFNLQFSILDTMGTLLTTTEILLTSLIFQHAAFFSLGGSNNISTLDLSNVLNGMSDYNVFIVGPLTFISNWVGPIFFSTAGMVLLRKRQLPATQQESSKGGDKGNNSSLSTAETTSASTITSPYLDQAILFTTFWCTAGLAVMASCTALRTHLFIWTVFSPKYIYTMIWSVLHHLLINLGWGALVFWANGVALQ